LRPEKTIYHPDLDTENWAMGSISFFHKMTSNEKSLNYNVIDLVESTIFSYKFLSPSEFIQKSYDFLKTNWTLLPYHTVFAGTTIPTSGTVHKCCVVWRLGPNAISHGGNGIVLQNLRWHIYFWKIKEKNKRKIIVVCQVPFYGPYSIVVQCPFTAHLNGPYVPMSKPTLYSAVRTISV
jgi:hypothetical protein